MYILKVTTAYGLDKQTYNIQYKNSISHAVKYYTTSSHKLIIRLQIILGVFPKVAGSDY